ncbi:Glucoside xylosyltransferase 2 [Orchesella cincta]|uniref:UDP-D-xylose:beta-D-glucoside alpha-1,3-D-xylosyltransferase n=1 Tax=Orchesella cincta TaxID=48709 RepID=A0A1D2MT16_ORCCI|nr:Glucoside xylosyltransferase 2 [Orchesella cincta]
MANESWFRPSLREDDFPVDEDLGVPPPPRIFQTNVAYLKNQKLVLLLIFLLLAIPLYFSIIDVHQDGPTFVDLDIKKFLLEKNAAASHNADSNEGSFFGVFRETENQRTEIKTIQNITFGITSCGKGVLETSVTSIKSVLLSAMTYGVKHLDGRIFVDTEQRMDDMSTILEEIKDGIPSSISLKFTYEIYVVADVIPNKNSYLWIELYKQCAAVHLFIEKAIPDVQEILFLDADTLVLGDLREVWSYFGKMDKKQFMGLTLEQSSSGFPSFYEKHSRIPFVPPTGVSSGVMLLNLTRIRQYDWETKITNVLSSFAHDLLRGDQDIINALFYFNREYLKILPCIYNFRRSNCKVEQHCREAATHGIQILHGNSKTFEEDGEFRKIYTVYRRFSIKTGKFMKDVVKPIMMYYENLRNSKTVFDSGCIAVGRQMFNRWWNHNGKNGPKIEL